MSALNPSSLKEAAAVIREGRVTSLEMTKAAIARARAAQPTINAFIEIEEEAALEAASLADRMLAEGGPTGSLHGVPLAHKDMYDRAGKITGCGSKIRAGNVATSTSTVMQRLEAAGAISIGRLNMSEFAMGPTGDNAHHSRARNPIDPQRITGGSSSGSGASVGAGVVLAALGSDTGGSIRLPSACCGVAGIKPTQGRVSRAGAMPLSFSQDCIGPLAKSMADAYQILGIISGPDGRDPTCLSVDPLGELLSDISMLRIGVAGGMFAEGLDAAVGKRIETAIAALSRIGSKVSAAKIPDLSAIPELANVVAMAEAGAVHFDGMRNRPDDYGPQVRMRLSQSLAMPAPVYLRALQMRAPMLAEFLDTAFADADVLIAPVMSILPPLSSEVDVGASPEMNRVVSAMTAFTRPFSYLGLPVASLPVACSAEGLPVALQVIGRPWQEQAVCSVAHKLEKALSLEPFANAALVARQALEHV
jgi:aspartyl-tRNA(Asn)/glutamyl-tRNA(Gln) amidotransferase subunit A